MKKIKSILAFALALSMRLMDLVRLKLRTEHS